jgi:hypothetical protein
MVSLNTIFTLGVIGAGLLAFTSLGGAGGIGQKLGGTFGGGIRSFNENITRSFNAALQGLNPFAAAQESEGEKINLTLSSDPAMYTDPKSVTLPEPYRPSAPGGAVDTSPIPPAIPSRTTPTPEVITGKTYLERTLQYVQQPLTVIEPRQAQLNVIARAKSDYGGYGSASSQSRELQSLLATNAAKYGSYFN